MVTKTKAKGVKKEGRAKVGKLTLKKETVKELSTSQKKQIKGGGQEQVLTIGCTLNCSLRACGACALSTLRS